MHSCYTPAIAYGFCDNAKRDYALSRSYVRDNYPGVSSDALDIMRNCACDYFIGIDASIDASGKLYYSDDDYVSLMKLVTKYEEFHGMKVELTFSAVICSGDYESEHYEYTFDDMF